MWTMYAPEPALLSGHGRYVAGLSSHEALSREDMQRHLRALFEQW